MTVKPPENPVHQAIRDLHSLQVLQQNRLLALEALAEALLARLDPQALPGLAEKYDANLDRLAAATASAQQRPHLWAQWSTLIAALHKPAGPAASNGVGEA